MEITLPNILNIVIATQEISKLIQQRLDEFSNRYGESETTHVFKTIEAPDPDEISFDDYCNDILITWMSDIGGCDNTYLISHSFNAKYFDNDIWKEFLNNHQTVIDERNASIDKKTKEDSKRKIEYKKQVIQNYLKEIEDLENTLK